MFLWFDASSYGGWGCHLWVMMHGGLGLMVLLRIEGGEGSFGFREQVDYLDSDFGFHIRVEKFAFCSPPKDAASASSI